MSSISSSDSPVIDLALVRQTPFTSSTPAASKAVKAPKPHVNHVSGLGKKKLKKKKGHMDQIGVKMILFFLLKLVAMPN